MLIADITVISIHAPLTGSDVVSDYVPKRLYISIHAPLTGSDSGPDPCDRSRHRFQSTLPSQGATKNDKMDSDLITEFQSTLPSQGATFFTAEMIGATAISIHAPLTGSDESRTSAGQNRIISIHAPLTGSDVRYTVKRSESYNFNPRSPHRERPNLPVLKRVFLRFQSTLPSQGATANIHIKFLCDLLFSTLSSKISLLFRVFHR